ITLNGAETGKIVTVKGRFYNRNHSPQVFVHEDNSEEMNDVELLKGLIQAESWQRDLAKDPSLTTESLAARNSLEPEYVRRRLFLALLSPRIKEAIICGTLHPQWTIQDFTRKKPQISWKAQEAVFLAAN
ncbi:MAG: hypothetical protein LBF84_03095, partial [Holosporales bacterium]|nr:hypothetical protein [Holosporales bacterium]